MQMPLLTTVSTVVWGVSLSTCRTRLSLFFSSQVDKALLDDTMAKGQRTIIQKLEMMAVLAAIKVWKALIKSRRVVLFTDSEAVRGSFLKSWSANEDSDKMINIIFQVEEELDVPVWIERVPSQSNPSDILSRETVEKFGKAEKVQVDPWEMSKLVSTMMTSPKPLTGAEARLWEVSQPFPHFQKEA